MYFDMAGVNDLVSCTLLTRQSVLFTLTCNERRALRSVCSYPGSDSALPVATRPCFLRLTTKGIFCKVLIPQHSGLEPFDMPVGFGVCTTTVGLFSENVRLTH
jgi:hypothetical protein